MKSLNKLECYFSNLPFDPERELSLGKAEYKAAKQERVYEGPQFSWRVFDGQGFVNFTRTRSLPKGTYVVCDLGNGKPPFWDTVASDLGPEVDFRYQLDACPNDIRFDQLKVAALPREQYEKILETPAEISLHRANEIRDRRRSLYSPERQSYHKLLDEIGRAIEREYGSKIKSGECWFDARIRIEVPQVDGVQKLFKQPVAPIVLKIGNQVVLLEKSE